MNIVLLNIFIILGAILMRNVISLNSYSGFNKPPMFGDYEAQRHWMEVTINLPSYQWYSNSTDNDLQYWGLDYPPLTAYHSWICGQVAKLINPDWVKLFDSRGFESYQHKVFMRYTALLSDVACFMAAVAVYCFTGSSGSSRVEQILQACVLLFYPGLVLIDHGHFQYNHVCLGLTLLAVACLHKQHDCIGAVAFVLALNYKQMALYYAMPFFCYLLGKCFCSKEFWIWKLAKIGTCVIVTFVLCWLPFIQEVSVAKQVLHRLFPFARGLFEDKVANIWCSISVIVKLKNFLSTESQALLCTVCTGIALLPSSVDLLLRPSIQRFKLALVNSSLLFFLLSFQVHEKTILLPALPASLMFSHHPLLTLWFLQLSTLSMWPLLLKDGLSMSTACAVLLFHVLTLTLHDMIAAGKPGSRTSSSHSITLFVARYHRLLYMLSVGGLCIIIALSCVIQPSPQLPDVFPLLISIYSCAAFLVFSGICHWLQFSC